MKVEIGDTVYIYNMKTKIVEEYTIIPTYHGQKIVGTHVAKDSDFGRTEYKDILLNGSDIENGIILSESNLAKTLIGKELNSEISFLDEDLSETTYKIVEIKKH